MSHNRPPQRAVLLCLAAIVAWGSLPLALKICLKTVDPLTVTLVRFAVAGTITMILQRRPILEGFGGLGPHLKLLLLGGIALIRLGRLDTPSSTRRIRQFQPAVNAKFNPA